MKKITVTFVVNEKQLKDMDTTFKDELGWLENSGIHAIDIKEEKTRELAYENGDIFLKNEFIKQHMTTFKSDYKLALSVWNTEKGTLQSQDDIDECIREIEICD